LKNPFLILLLVFSACFSQKHEHDKFTYWKFDLSVPLRGNPHRDEVNPYTGEKGYWFVPDGISTKIGYGIHLDQWLLVGVDTGIDWKISTPIVAVPVYGNLRISPLVGEETRIYLQVGYGKCFAIGRGRLAGEYRRFSLGVESSDTSLFIDVALFGFNTNGIDNIGSLSIGLSHLLF
jgi:hypothetical protein